MTFQHTGHGCLGVGGVLGAFGVHLPDHSKLPKPDHHDFGGDHHSLGGLTHHAGTSMPMPAEPLKLIFGDPALASSEHAFSLAAIPVGGGVTMSIVALVAVVCMAIILASALAKTVVVRCSG